MYDMKRVLYKYGFINMVPEAKVFKISNIVNYSFNADMNIIWFPNNYFGKYINITTCITYRLVNRCFQ